MVGRHVIEVTIDQLHETEQAIEAQRLYVASLSDPVVKATAARTLATLEDIRGIMERTRDLLVERETSRSSCKTLVPPGRAGRARSAAQRQGRAAETTRRDKPCSACAR